MGNTEGKESRFGDTTTGLFGVASTTTSTGSADGAYDSFTPVGGLGLLTGMVQAYIFTILAAVYIAAATRIRDRQSASGSGAASATGAAPSEEHSHG